MLFTIIKIVLTVVAVVICAALLLFIYALISGTFIPKKLRNVPKNTSPLFADGKAQIGAHRAGAGIAPENTPLAFDICLNAENFEVQELEFDLHLTKDDKLIILHDPTLEHPADEPYNVRVFDARFYKPHYPFMVKVVEETFYICI